MTVEAEIAGVAEAETAGDTEAEIAGDAEAETAGGAMAEIAGDAEAETAGDAEAVPQPSRGGGSEAYTRPTGVLTWTRCRGGATWGSLSTAGRAAVSHPGASLP